MEYTPYMVTGLLLFGGIVQCAFAQNDYTPEQIHIATDSSSSMIIVWNTQKDTDESTVLYGTDQLALKLSATGTRTKFVDGGSEKRAQFVHMTNVTNLQADTEYYYMVGCMQYGFSDIMSFKTWPAGNNWSPRLALFGDMGKENAKSLPRLETDVAKGMYDAIIHVGDLAYNMFENNGRTGDDFMNMIQPIASSLPYMTCPGNHENSYNFSNYKNRFRMPGDIDQRMYYSFKMGPIRFISTSTEFVFFPNYGLIQIAMHYQWLENELKDANLPENRAKQPWVITFGHRPMYCSASDGDDCSHAESLIRTGICPMGVFGWEKLFYENGVDVAIWAHEHNYERLFPVYNRQIMNGSKAEPYTNPKAPVHITTGSAGCREDHNPFVKNPEPWSAFRSLDYGYTRMQVLNSTHLALEQVSDNQGGKVIDKIMVIKDKHGSYKHDAAPVEPVGDIETLMKLFKQRMNEERISSF